MARKASSARAVKKVNKTREIMEYHYAHPEARPRNIVSALKRRGIDVSPQYVSTILFNHRKKLRAAEIVGDSAGSLHGEASKGISAREIMLAKQLVKQTGSVNAAHKALDLYGDIIA